MSFSVNKSQKTGEWKTMRMFLSKEHCCMENRDFIYRLIVYLMTLQLVQTI